MFQFRTLSLNQPQSKQPAELLKIVNNFSETQQFVELSNLPELETDTCRYLNDIIQIIKQGETQQLKRLEWIYCLYHKIEWDRENPQISQTTSKLIWKAALKDSWLKQTLLWLLVLHHSHSSPILSQSLVGTFSFFVKENGNHDSEILAIIQLIIAEKYEQLAVIALENNLTPQELLNKVNLPATIPAVNHTLNHVVKIFVQHKQPEWLLRCLQQMSPEQQCQQVNNLLTTINPETGSRFLSIVEWLRQNYGPRTINSKWHDLSSQAQLALREWIGAASWGDFDKLITILIRDLNSRLASLPSGSKKYKDLDYQTNQLERRRGFWSNYRQRFERLRILVPASTSWISEQLNRDIDILIDDGGSETEVCIFDFGDWFIVEFFRGTGSEILLFNRNLAPIFEETLFQSKNLSISDIRRLRRFGGEIHDHVFLWQYYAEKWLRTKHEIYPNEGISYFQGLDRPFNRYNPTTGLLEPSLDKERNRERVLARWRRDMGRLYGENF